MYCGRKETDWDQWEWGDTAKFWLLVEQPVGGNEYSGRRLEYWLELLKLV